jgi:hypothetical protein
MSVIHIGCPHCGTSFDAQIQGEGANMMVFCCVRCKTPLMYFHGEVAELDRDEFAGLRQKLSRAIDAVTAGDGTMAQVAAALKKMDIEGVKGKECTPFLLKTIVELTGGDSLESNIKLVLNNAAVGSEVAKEYCKIK